jgi:hypothetical protein
MKRIKTMLTAICVFSIEGGVLAFKAQRFTSTMVYCSTLDENDKQVCELASFQGINNGLWPTTTTPCAAGINYYITNSKNCTTDGFAPSPRTTFWPIDSQ